MRVCHQLGWPAILSVNETTIQAVAVSGSGGSTITVPIDLVALGTESGVGFSLNFDPTVLKYLGATIGSGASGSAWEVNTNQAASGQVGFGAALFNGTFPAGTNEVFDVTFLVNPVTNATLTTVSFGAQPTPEQVSDPQAQTLPK